jgi:hypothetical protein
LLPIHTIHRALWLAESGEPEDLEAARIEFDRLPALKQRDILGNYAKHWQRKSQREKRRAAHAAGV